MKDGSLDLKVTEARLWSLIEQRCQPGADRETLDRRIWDLFGEDWAVLYTDLSGFSRRVAAFGIIHFLQVIYEQNRLFLPIIERHDGVLIKIEADSLLVIFRRASSAFDCVLEMRDATHVFNASRAPEDQILLCAGLGYGRVLRLGDSDVYGHEVNISSKLGEDTAKTDEILLSKAARHSVGDRPGLRFVEVHGSIAGTESYFKLTAGGGST